MKVQRVDGGGRILLGDNTGGGAFMLRPIKFQKVWSSDFKLGFEFRKTPLQPDLP
jgi:hypothetical protein